MSYKKPLSQFRFNNEIKTSLSPFFKIKLSTMQYTLKQRYPSLKPLSKIKNREPFSRNT